MQTLKVKIKAAARRVLGPVARPILRRLRPRLQRYLGIQPAGFQALQSNPPDWHQHLPALVNAADSVAAIAHEQVRLRREQQAALADIRSAVARLRAGGAGRAAVKILSPQKVEQARAQGVRLSIGRGGAPAGWLAVSTREAPGVDIVADLDALPFAAGEVAEIACSHVLDAYSQHELEHALLPHWAGLLRSGGRLRAIATDGEVLLRAAAGGELAFEDFRDTVYGHAGAERLNLFTPQSLATALHSAGFVNLELLAEGREFEVAAARP